MITPTDIPITVYCNSAYDAEFDFANSDGSAYDLTGWTLTAQTTSADTYNALPFEVAVDEEAGSVVLSLTSDVTVDMNDKALTNYTISGTAPDDSGPYFLVKGVVTVVDVSIAAI